MKEKERDEPTKRKTNRAIVGTFSQLLLGTKKLNPGVRGVRVRVRVMVAGVESSRSVTYCLPSLQVASPPVDNRYPGREACK